MDPGGEHAFSFSILDSEEIIRHPTRVSDCHDQQPNPLQFIFHRHSVINTFFLLHFESLNLSEYICDITWTNYCYFENPNQTVLRATKL